jgi:hypothetical protein
VKEAETVVAGHGGPLTGDAARRTLDEDLAYLGAVRRDGADAALPPGRATPHQRRIHAENVSRASLP